jgi:formate C-acetyltransferase
MLKVLKTNFSDEFDHQQFLNRSSKYGNDRNRVDNYAVMVMEHYCTYLKGKRSDLGGKFYAQPFTFLWLVDAGQRTAASPDGRRSGENLAYSLSPMQGRDINGLTAMLNSLSKMPYLLAPGGSSAIIEVDPQLFEEKNIDLMVSILQTAIGKGVAQMQFNVITEDTLKEAQNNPELHQNLSVRVSGFSQRFCLLDKKIQDHIIARTKHKKL